MGKDTAWLTSVAALGCIVCGQPACIHHVRFGQGKSQRASDRLVLPLCFFHHQHGGFGFALHAGQKTWESKYGTELELLEQVYKTLDEPWPPIELTQLIANQKFGSRILFNK